MIGRSAKMFEGFLFFVGFFLTSACYLFCLAFDHYWKMRNSHHHRKPTPNWAITPRALDSSISLPWHWNKDSISQLWKLCKPLTHSSTGCWVDQCVLNWNGYLVTVTHTATHNTHNPVYIQTHTYIPKHENLYHTDLHTNIQPNTHR